MPTSWEMPRPKGPDGRRGGGDTADTPRAFRAIVEGRVQGVGFRYSAMHEAHSLGIRGWVRNEDDGSVGIFAEGDSASLDRYAAWLERGPPGAVVTALRLHAATPTGTFSDFDVAF